MSSRLLTLTPCTFIAMGDKVNFLQACSRYLLSRISNEKEKHAVNDIICMASTFTMVSPMTSPDIAAAPSMAVSAATTPPDDNRIPLQRGCSWLEYMGTDDPKTSVKCGCRSAD